jgi:hypothetical protein
MTPATAIATAVVGIAVATAVATAVVGIAVTAAIVATTVGVAIAVAAATPTKSYAEAATTTPTTTPATTSPSSVIRIRSFFFDCTRVVVSSHLSNWILSKPSLAIIILCRSSFVC